MHQNRLRTPSYDGVRSRFGDTPTVQSTSPWTKFLVKCLTPPPPHPHLTDLTRFEDSCLISHGSSTLQFTFEINRLKFLSMIFIPAPLTCEVLAWAVLSPPPPPTKAPNESLEKCYVIYCQPRQSWMSVKTEWRVDFNGTLSSDKWESQEKWSWSLILDLLSTDCPVSD